MLRDDPDGVLAARGMTVNFRGGMEHKGASGATLAIVGTAGRKEDADRLDAGSMDKMQEAAERYVAELAAKGLSITRLVSGGAAYADHVAVRLFLRGAVPELVLHLPARFEKGQFVDSGIVDAVKNPGGTSNHYHRLFRQKTGIDGLGEIEAAIKKGAKITISDGLFDRNDLVAQHADACLACTFGDGPMLKDSGTAYTMGAFLALNRGPSAHFDLTSETLHYDARVAAKYFRAPKSTAPSRDKPAQAKARVQFDAIRHLPPAYASLSSWDQVVRGRDHVLWAPSIDDFARLIRGEFVELPGGLDKLPGHELRLAVPSSELPSPEGYNAIRGAAGQRLETALLSGDIRGAMIRIRGKEPVAANDLTPQLAQWANELVRPADMLQPFAELEHKAVGSNEVRMGRIVAARPGVLPLEAWRVLLPALESRDQKWAAVVSGLSDSQRNLRRIVAAKIDMGSALFGLEADAVTAEAIADSVQRSQSFLRSFTREPRASSLRREATRDDPTAIEIDPSAPMEEWDPRGFAWFLRQVSLIYPVERSAPLDPIHSLAEKFLKEADAGRCFSANRFLHSLAGSRDGTASSQAVASARQDFGAWLEGRLQRMVIDTLFAREVPGDRGPLLGLRAFSDPAASFLSAHSIPPAAEGVVVNFHTPSELERDEERASEQVVSEAQGTQDSLASMTETRVGLPVRFPTRAEALHAALVPTYPASHVGMRHDGSKMEKGTVASLLSGLAGAGEGRGNMRISGGGDAGHVVQDLALRAYVEDVKERVGEKVGLPLNDLPELAGDRSATFMRYLSQQVALANCGWAGNAPATSLVTEVAKGDLAPKSLLNGLGKYVATRVVAVPEANAPSEASKSPRPITGFHDGAHDFLSNFYPQRVTFRGLVFPSAENAYQFAKIETPTKEQAQFFQTCTPADAKRAGKSLSRRADWDGIKLKVMEDILREKFSNPQRASDLRRTGTRPLIEGNNWHDNFWGVSPEPRTPEEISAVLSDPRRNQLGRLLMKIRDELDGAAPVPQVINLRTDSSAVSRPGVLYIGRPGPKTPDARFGNPFTRFPNISGTIQVKDDQEAVDCFRSWLEGATHRGFAQEHRREILANLQAVREARELACFCHPGPCHGNVLVEFAFSREKAGKETHSASASLRDLSAETVLEMFRSRAAALFHELTGEREHGRKLLLPVDTGNPLLLGRTAVVYPNAVLAKAEVAAWVNKAEPFLGRLPEDPSELRPAASKALSPPSDVPTAPSLLADAAEQLSAIAKQVELEATSQRADGRPAGLEAVAPLEALFEAHSALKVSSAGGSFSEPASAEVLFPLTRILSSLPLQLAPIAGLREAENRDFVDLLSSAVTWKSASDAERDLARIYGLQLDPSARESITGALGFRQTAAKQEQNRAHVHRLLDRIELITRAIVTEYPMAEHSLPEIRMLVPARLAIARAQLRAAPGSEPFAAGLKTVRSIADSALSLGKNPGDTARALRQSVTLQRVTTEATHNLMSAGRLVVPLVSAVDASNRLIVGGYGGAYVTFLDRIGICPATKGKGPMSVVFDRDHILADQAMTRWAKTGAVVVDERGIRDMDDREQLAALPAVRYLPRGISPICHAVGPRDYARWRDGLAERAAPSHREPEAARELSEHFHSL